MANIVDTALAKAMVFAARWLSVAVLAVFVFGRSAAVSARRLWSTSTGRLPPVGQQLLDPAVQLRGQAREDVLQVGPRLVPVELGRLQQAHHYSGPLAGQLTADEQPIAPPEGPGSDPVLAASRCELIARILDHVGLHRAQHLRALAEDQPDTEASAPRIWPMQAVRSSFSPSRVRCRRIDFRALKRLDGTPRDRSRQCHGNDPARR